MREILSIYLSQGGIQTGNAYWHLYCLEHGIQFDITMPSDLTIGNGNDSISTVFADTDTSRHVTRVVFLGLDTTVHDEVRKGAFR